MAGTEPATARLRFTNPDVIAMPEAAPEIGIHEDDRIGYIEIPGVPSDEVMKASTIDYADIVSGKKAIKEDRAVVVIDAAPDCADRHELRDGRVVPGGYLQAAAVEALLSGRWLQRRPRRGHRVHRAWGDLLAAMATCGLAVGGRGVWAGCVLAGHRRLLCRARWGGVYCEPGGAAAGDDRVGAVGRLWSVYTGLWRNWYGVPST